jgi:hypothetical protein
MGGNGRMLPCMEPAAEGKTSHPPQAKPSESTSDGPSRTVESASPPAGGEAAEVRVSGRGGTWWARVLGSAGGSRARSAPLLLVGFRQDGAQEPTLEALVAGRVLADVPDDALEGALARAGEHPAPLRKTPFFEDADGARRS